MKMLSHLDSKTTEMKVCGHRRRINTTEKKKARREIRLRKSLAKSKLRAGHFSPFGEGFGCLCNTKNKGEDYHLSQGKFPY